MPLNRRSLVLIISAAVVVAAAIVVAASVFSVGTTYEFLLKDRVSGQWVWDAAIGLQDRLAYSFYQSDSGVVPLTLTHLKPGRAVLQIAAPGYVPVSLPVTLRRGVNRRAEPIEMTGYEIPDLDHFSVFEKLEGGDIAAELRPVGRDGHAVLNHPCLDLWVGSRVTVELKDGAPVSDSVEAGWTRGRELFAGRIDWEWSPAPEAVFRYQARIRGETIAPDPSLYRVIDYVIIVADPRRISSPELRAVMEAAPSLGSLPPLKAYLAAQGAGRFTAFFDTSANVKGFEQ